VGVATCGNELLGRQAGVISGCALLVDYILTITVSIASGGDALFSLLPVEYHKYKLLVEFGAIAFLTLVNLRGVKESITTLLAIFLTFIVTHVILIGAAFLFHLAGDANSGPASSHSGFHDGAMQLGKWGMFMLFLRAYSLGGGHVHRNRSGVERIAIMRDPKVRQASATDLYGGVVACTAAGPDYVLLAHRYQSVEGQTLNAALAHQMFVGFDSARGRRQTGSLD